MCCSLIIRTQVRALVLRLQFSGHPGQHRQTPMGGTTAHLPILLNISNPEEGTPKPPRVETMASTKTTKPEVRKVTLNTLSYKRSCTKDLITTPQELDDCPSPPEELTRIMQPQERPHNGLRVNRTLLPQVTGELDSTTGKVSPRQQKELSVKQTITWYLLSRTRQPAASQLLLNNIFNPEEGTPTPPREETVASTKADQSKVTSKISYSRTIFDIAPSLPPHRTREKTELQADFNRYKLDSPHSGPHTNVYTTSFRLLDRPPIPTKTSPRGTKSDNTVRSTGPPTIHSDKEQVSTIHIAPLFH